LEIFLEKKRRGARKIRVGRNGLDWLDGPTTLIKEECDGSLSEAISRCLRQLKGFMCFEDEEELGMMGSDLN
jgi:hypothetical protein